MSLDFVIIPILYNYQQHAYDIKTELKKINNKKINVEVDLDYSKLFSSRINRWKKLGCNIVTIDDDFKDTRLIVIRFHEKGSRPNTMYLQDFIDLVESFEDDIINGDQIIIKDNTKQNEVTKQSEAANQNEVTNQREVTNQLPPLKNPDELNDETNTKGCIIC